MSDKFTMMEGIEIAAVTSKALLVVHADGTEEHWIPISCLNLDETTVEFKQGEVGDLSVATWFLTKNGIEVG